MSGSRFVYVTYIRTTPEKLWHALTTPEIIVGTAHMARAARFEWLLSHRSASLQWSRTAQRTQRCAIE